MGTIYRNGVPFVGSGGAGGVEMTQAEYDLLPESEKMNGAIYFITDGDVSYPSASQMRYDNTESQIPSTTVQGAIDENRIEINDLKAGLTWKLAGTTTGTTPLSLPADYNELQVNVTLTSNYQVTQHFVRDELNGGWYLWGAAYASSSAPSTPLPVFAAAYISSTTFTLQSAQYSSTVVTNSAVTKVYYR